MNIKILSEDELSQDDKDQINQLDLVCFGQEAVDKVPIYYFAPTFKHLLLFDGQKLVSYLRIILREIDWDSKKVLMGGIGSVETDPEYQGKGYAGRILEIAMKILKDENADFALLQTNIARGEKLYGKVGFVPANKSYAVLDVNDNQRVVKAKDVMIAPIQNPKIVEEIIKSKETLFVGKGDW